MVFLMVQLNLLWLVFTLLGGVVLGTAPATIAAAHCVREHGEGRLNRPVATFIRTWRSEFYGANLALLPLAGMLTVLGWNYLVYSAAGPDASLPRLATLAALIVGGTVCTWLPGLYVHYDVPRSRFLLTGLRLTLGKPVFSVLQLLMVTAAVYASSKITLLPLVVAVGTWLYLSTWLTLRCFAQNEAFLAA
ncbi:hypothetical protein SBI_08632 [Streptomyces bingchenggensis BCW-1]|uniref:Integral membrane protein n=1 Tax=Streptomyces bingchenggensis (strain BCW-1) TaxID=749414 RepID=D7BW40_STRBB|nr:hypothetical protein SBI_08632 [Streptomyces bingchenggensis BCW-1]